MPNQPTTPEQWTVIAWSGIIFCVVAGAAAFYFSFQAPANNPGLALHLRQFGAALFVFAGVAFGVKRAVEYFLG